MPPAALLPMISQCVLWSGLAFLAYATVGYAALTRWRARRARRAAVEPRIPWITPPPVAVVLCGHNEAARLPDRLRNLADTDHPHDRLHLIVVDDGSTDGTAAAVAAVADTLPVRVTVLRQEQRRGKPAGLNRARQAVAEPLVVLTDVRQRFTPSTIPALVAAMADPGVGAVSGHLDIASADGAAGRGVGRYWEMERQLRADEAVLDSCIGCTGAVYALRRELWEEIPGDTLIDDVELPLRIAARGYRIDFRPEARAFDPQPLDPAREAIRKRRTLAGNFQMWARHPAWALPWGHRLWWAIFWHKLSRLLVPVVLPLVLAASLMLADTHLLYAAMAAGQLALYALAAAGLAFPAWRAPWFSLPAAFLFLQWQVVRGAWLWVTGGYRQGWELAR